MLRIDITGAQEIETFFQKLAGALDTQKILDEGGAVLLNRTRTRFLAEVDPLGVPWLPSRAAIYRKKMGFGGGTLFKTGRLFYSLQLASEGANGRSIGTNASSIMGFDYPRKHNFGIGFPRRQFLGFGDQDVAIMSDVIIHRIKQALQ